MHTLTKLIFQVSVSKTKQKAKAWTPIFIHYIKLNQKVLSFYAI